MSSVSGIIKIVAGALGVVIGGKTAKEAFLDVGGHLACRRFVSELSVFAESGSSKIDKFLFDVFLYRYDRKDSFTTLLDVRRLIIRYSDDGVKMDPDDLEDLYNRVRETFLEIVNEYKDTRYHGDIVQADEQYEIELINKLKKLMMRSAGYRVTVENEFTPEMEGYVKELKKKYGYSKDELYRLMLQLAREQNYKLEHDEHYIAFI